MNKARTLDTISVGESLYISNIDASCGELERLSALGVYVGARVRSVGRGPLGDPLMLAVGGRVIAVRRRNLSAILVAG